MPMLKIIVQDLDKETPAEPEIMEAEELDFAVMVILEKGTTGGDTSVYFA